MNSRIVVLCVVVLFAACLLVAEAKKGEQGGKGGGKGQGMKCLGESFQLDKETKATWDECNKSDKKEDKSDDESDDDDDEKKKRNRKKNACAIDCFYRKTNQITSDGNLDIAQIETSIKNIFPTAAHTGLISDMKVCAKEVTEKLITDDDCKTFKKYQTCWFKAMKTNCHKKENKDKSDDGEQK